MLHLDEIEYPDGIALVSEKLTCGLIELGLGICNDDRLAAFCCLQNQISGDASGLSCARCTANGQVLIKPGFLWQRNNLPSINHAQDIPVCTARRCDIKTGFCLPECHKRCCSIASEFRNRQVPIAVCGTSSAAPKAQSEQAQDCDAN